MADISAIKLPDNTTYNIKDKISGYTTNTGTVTSVGVSNDINGGLSISGSPITSSGTITVGLDTAYGDTKNPYGDKTANYVLAGPTSGSAATPSFRALVAADIPDLSGTYSTTDEKTKIELTETYNTYYPLFGDSTLISTAGKPKISNNFKIITGGSYATTRIQVGLLSSQGQLALSGALGEEITNYVGVITPTVLTEDRIYTLPNATGTIALISDIPTITLNGSTTTSPSFYAPTTVGTNGNYLKSNGSSAPSWETFPTIVNTRGTPASGGTTLSLVNTGDMYTWNNKQDALVSGTNIKTINNTSLLGSGDITIGGTQAKIVRWTESS